jgi:hypothetical protein
MLSFLIAAVLRLRSRGQITRKLMYFGRLGDLLGFGPSAPPYSPRIFFTVSEAISVMIFTATS